MRRGLAEAEAGIDSQILDTGRPRGGGAFGQKQAHLGHDVVIDGLELHGLRHAAHVHDDRGGLAPRRHGDHLRIVQSADVVDDTRARAQALIGHLGLGGVDRQQHGGLSGQRPHHRQDAAQLLLERDGIGARAAAFTADIDDVGPVVNQRAGAGQRLVGIEVQTAVGK